MAPVLPATVLHWYYLPCVWYTPPTLPAPTCVLPFTHVCVLCVCPALCVAYSTLLQAPGWMWLELDGDGYLTVCVWW